jgi:RNA polymerase sigma-70 factor (ECF subfamily)
MELEQLPDENELNLLALSVEEINEQIYLLPNGCRQVFVLYVQENLSHKEIGELLRISVSTSKSQYHRARSLLRKKFQTRTNG